MTTDKETVPWYRRTRRWGQTNITELDPLRYDIAWWREHWRRTRVQGVIINAGGIVAYYPSRFPLHHRAEHLGKGDLFGEVSQAARQEGLVVLARRSRATQKYLPVSPAAGRYARQAWRSKMQTCRQYRTAVRSSGKPDLLPRWPGRSLWRLLAGMPKPR